jgi:hypothetical protein
MFTQELDVEYIVKLCTTQKMRSHRYMRIHSLGIHTTSTKKYFRLVTRMEYHSDIMATSGTNSNFYDVAATILNPDANSRSLSLRILESLGEHRTVVEHVNFDTSSFKASAEFSCDKYLETLFSDMGWYMRHEGFFLNHLVERRLKHFIVKGLGEGDHMVANYNIISTVDPYNGYLFGEIETSKGNVPYAPEVHLNTKTPSAPTKATNYWDAAMFILGLISAIPSIKKNAIATTDLSRKDLAEYIISNFLDLYVPPGLLVAISQKPEERVNDLTTNFFRFSHKYMWHEVYNSNLFGYGELFDPTDNRLLARPYVMFNSQISRVRKEQKDKPENSVNPNMVEMIDNLVGTYNVYSTFGSVGGAYNAKEIIGSTVLASELLINELEESHERAHGREDMWNDVCMSKARNAVMHYAFMGVKPSFKVTYQDEKQADLNTTGIGAVVQCMTIVWNELMNTKSDDGKYQLFVRVPNVNTYIPNPAVVSEDDVKTYRAAGMMLAKFICSQQLETRLAVSLNKAFFKFVMRGVPIRYIEKYSEAGRQENPHFDLVDLALVDREKAYKLFQLLRSEISNESTMEDLDPTYVASAGDCVTENVDTYIHKHVIASLMGKEDCLEYPKSWIEFGNGFDVVLGSPDPMGMRVKDNIWGRSFRLTTETTSSLTLRSVLARTLIITPDINLSGLEIYEKGNVIIDVHSDYHRKHTTHTDESEYGACMKCVLLKYIKSMDSERAKKFLVWCTASDILDGSRNISIAFTTKSWENLPNVQTCFRTIYIPDYIDHQKAKNRTKYEIYSHIASKMNMAIEEISYGTA